MTRETCERYAALGGPDSDHAVAMPADHDHARDLKARCGRFWCSTAIGGCGTELTARVAPGRVPHFAHRPGAVCAVLRDPVSHALAWEHLVMQRALQRWLEGLGYAVTLEERVVGGRADVHVSTGRGEHILEVQRSPLSVPERVRRTQLYAAGARSVTWLWDSPRRDADADLQLRADGIAFTTRIDDLGVVQVGTLWRTHDPDEPGTSWDVGWDDLTTCDLDDEGLLTSHRAFARAVTDIFLQDQDERDALAAQRREQEQAQLEESRRRLQEDADRREQHRKDRERHELENARAQIAASRSRDASPHSRPPAEWMPAPPAPRRMAPRPPDKILPPRTLAARRAGRPLDDWAPPEGWDALLELPDHLRESARQLVDWVCCYDSGPVSDLAWVDVPDPDGQQLNWLLHHDYIELYALNRRWRGLRAPSGARR